MKDQGLLIHLPHLRLLFTARADETSANDCGSTCGRGCDARHRGRAHGCGPSLRARGDGCAYLLYGNTFTITSFYLSCTIYPSKFDYKTLFVIDIEEKGQHYEEGHDINRSYFDLDMHN